jgi:predicted transcriptional regulator
MNGTAKRQAQDLLAVLPDDATWDDIVYELAVRRSIERGLADAEAGRLRSVEDVRGDFDI